MADEERSKWLSEFEKIKGHSSGLFDNEEWSEFEYFIDGYNLALNVVKNNVVLDGVSISLERAKKYARHQHFLGMQGNELVEFEDWKTD